MHQLEARCDARALRLVVGQGVRLLEERHRRVPLAVATVEHRARCDAEVDVRTEIHGVLDRARALLSPLHLVDIGREVGGPHERHELAVVQPDVRIVREGGDAAFEVRPRFSRVLLVASGRAVAEQGFHVLVEGMVRGIELDDGV